MHVSDAAKHAPPPPNNCKSGALRKCVNWKGNHASTNKSCPVLKEHIKGLFENNKKKKTYSEILAKQQKQIYDNQQKQETRITTITAQQINIEQMQNTINTHQQTINKQSEEIKMQYNSINILNSTITKQDKEINDTNTSFIAVMDKINQHIRIYTL